MKVRVVISGRSWATGFSSTPPWLRRWLHYKMKIPCLVIIIGLVFQSVIAAAQQLSVGPGGVTSGSRGTPPKRIRVCAPLTGAQARLKERV
jgi:hypothetical protein